MHMDIIKSLNWRYATKKFDSNRILDEEKVDIVKNAFNLTATSYGLQPLKMIVISDKKLQQELVASSYGQKQVAQASHILVLCINTIVDESYIKDYFKLVKDTRNTPREILKPFEDDLVKSFSSKDATSIENWTTKQAYLAMGNLLTVCAVEEIDACPMEGFIPAKYDEILNLTNRNLKSVLVMPIGYRHQDDTFASFKKVRKTLDDSVIVL